MLVQTISQCSSFVQSTTSHSWCVMTRKPFEVSVVLKVDMLLRRL